MGLILYLGVQIVKILKELIGVIQLIYLKID
jgi:hypothetical protein